VQASHDQLSSAAGPARRITARISRNNRGVVDCGGIVQRCFGERAKCRRSHSWRDGRAVPSRGSDARVFPAARRLVVPATDTSRTRDAHLQAGFDGLHGADELAP